MNLYEAVKAAVTTRTAAENYGIEVRRNGMARCPFHPDKTPSMKLDTRYHCFGCQADGDVIDFTARLFGLSPKAAAVKLSQDFGIGYERGNTQRPHSVLAELAEKRKQQEAETRCFRVLCDYYHLLRGWKERFAPKSPDEELHPLYCEAIKKIDYTEYLLDAFLSDGPEERREIVKAQEPRLSRIEKVVAQYAGARPEVHALPRKRNGRDYEIAI
jgi:hypothetical protein